MLDHSTVVSESEAELDFAILDLPSTDDGSKWSGKFVKMCAKQIGPSSYLMKFEGESGPTYHHFKWGVPKEFPHFSPRWLSTGATRTNLEQAVHYAELDMAECFDVTVHSVPTQKNT